MDAVFTSPLSKCDSFLLPNKQDYRFNYKFSPFQKEKADIV